MRNRRHPAAVTAMLLVLMLFGNLWPVAAKEIPPLERMLSRVPQAVMHGENAFLSYADVEALVGSVPGAAMPEVGQAMAIHVDTPEGKAYLHSLMMIAAGHAPLMQRLRFADEFRDGMGIDIAQIRQTMEVGYPPAQLVLLQGAFEQDAIQTALAPRGYQSTEGGEGLWCPDGDCAAGNTMDVNNRDRGFLFGGALGQRWPVVVREQLLAASANGALVQAVAAAEGPTLHEDQSLMTLVRAVAGPWDGAVGQLMQLYLVDAKLAVEQVEEAAGLMAMAHVQTEDAVWVVFGLPYVDEESAQNAKQRLQASIPAAQTRGGRPIASLLKGLKGQLSDLRVVTAPQGQALLLVPLRFPTQQQLNLTDDQAHAGKPYAMFMQMLLQRDLDWLAL